MRVHIEIITHGWEIERCEFPYLDEKTAENLRETLAACAKKAMGKEDGWRDYRITTYEYDSPEKKIVRGHFVEGEFVMVTIDGKDYVRKVRFSPLWGDLVITVHDKEYAYSEFKEADE